MTYSLALFHNSNKMIRRFLCTTDHVLVIVKKDTGRLELMSRFDLSQEEESNIQIIKETSIEELKKNQQSLHSSYFIKLLSSDDEVSDKELPLDFCHEEIKDQSLHWVIGSVSFCSLSMALVLTFASKEQVIAELKQEELRVVKIIKPPAALKPAQSVTNMARSSTPNTQKITKTKKIVKKSLKRMGALQALGALNSKAKHKSGLNLGASVTSAGPGLRSLSSSSGSGGVQQSVYSSGMVVQALGSGGNIKGGGGYGTKGQAAGGGQAGYGSLALVGSGGDFDLSESSSLSLESSGFDQSLIEKHIIKHIGKIRQCYNQALIRNTDLKGVFVSNLFIGQGAKVVRAKVHPSSKVKSSFISNCILKVLSAIHFKDVVIAKNRLLNIVYPFDLEALN